MAVLHREADLALEKIRQRVSQQVPAPTPRHGRGRPVDREVIQVIPRRDELRGHTAPLGDEAQKRIHEVDDALELGGRPGMMVDLGKVIRGQASPFRTASTIWAASRSPTCSVPRMRRRRATSRGARFEISIATSSVMTHFLGTSRRIAVDSRHAHTSRVTASCLRVSDVTRFA